MADRPPDPIQPSSQTTHGQTTHGQTTHGQKVRIQKVLSHHGLASRRQAESWIRGGRVQVNGQVAQVGQAVDPQVDRIAVDGVLLPTAPRALYILLHKPLGVVSTCHDPQGRPTVLHCLPPHLAQGQGLHPVGRLDTNSTGALLLSNDGDFTFRLTHPRHPLAKTYEVWVQGHPPPAILHRWRSGIVLDGKPTLPATVTILTQTSQQTCLQIQLWEGRNRQIRRVAAQLGYPVIALHRTAIGSLDLQSLAPRQWRFLQWQEQESFARLEPRNPQ